MSLTEGFAVSNGDLPDESGYYIVCIQKDESLPESMKKLEYSKHQGHSILYSGITKSLKDRERNHFRGSARNSTLRKSLGHVFGYTKEHLPGGKYRFIMSHEEKLSNWMTNNLMMYYTTSKSDLNKIEDMMISEFNPPLNIDKNFNSANMEFRTGLYKMRKDN